MSYLTIASFDGLTAGDLSGQDNWTVAPSHTGGTIDVDTYGGGQAAFLSSSVGNTTLYIRSWTTGELPNDRLDSGSRYTMNWTFNMSSALTSGTVSTGLSDASDTQFPWYLEVANTTGAVTLTDRNGVQSLGSVTLDTDHTVEVVVDENSDMTVNIDSAGATGGFKAAVVNASYIELYYGGGATVTDAFVWDNIVLKVQITNNIYKYFIGK